MWKILKWGYIPVSALFIALGIYSQAKEASTWGASAWVWLLIGGSVLISSSLTIIIKLSKENKEANNQLIEARKAQANIEHIISLRNRSVTSLQIPGLLMQMYDRSVVLVKPIGKLPDDVMTKINGLMEQLGYTPNNFPLISYLLPILSQFTDPYKIQIKATEFVQFNQQFRDFILNLQGLMSKENVGAMVLCSTDTMYQALLSDINRLRAGLPDQINTKIDHVVMFMTGVANLCYMAISYSPDIQDVLPTLAIIMPYFETICRNILQEDVAEVTKLLEKFLTGGELN